MEREVWLEIIQQGHQLGVLEYRITGGEPTLYPGLFDLLEEIPIHARISLNTNGIIESSVLQRLIISRIDRFNVSLDGPWKIHDQIRGTGTYQRVIQTLKKLVSNGKDIRVNMVVGRSNQRYVQDIAELCHSLGVENLSFNLLRPFGRTNCSDMLTRQENRTLVEKVASLKTKYNHINMTTPWLFVHERATPTIFTCGFSGITVSSDGKFHICGQYTSYYMQGAISIHETTLLSFWKRIQQDSFLQVCFNNSKCRNCKYYKKCPGRCPMLSKKILGKFEAEDPLCIA
jgi:radical SAM protein with 4Fe4S-binding SPASM domain